MPEKIFWNILLYNIMLRRYVKKSMEKSPINYSQCWEDPEVLRSALDIKSEDSVLSITSGGDNTLALLLLDPQKIVSIDLNPAQNYLLELKIDAAKSLSYREYLEFLGVIGSERRTALFKRLRSGVSPAASAWWENNLSLIEQGVVNCGRLERFIVRFARYVLPLVHSKRTILKLLSSRNIEEQRTFYRDRWDSKRWRFFFGLASNRFMLQRYARQPGMFAYTEGQTVADVYRKRLERHLTSVPIADNFFLHYSLTGRYGDVLPPYLEEKGYVRLRQMPASVLSITTDDLLSYLQSMPADTFSKFNLSDIFEALSPEQNDLLWGHIVRTAKNGAVVAYWNNLVERTYSSRVSSQIHTESKRVSDLHARDRVFFYDSFHVHTIIK